MTEDLYRKEALEHFGRRLYGDVVLKSPPAIWLITILLILVTLIILGLFVLGKVETDAGPLAVWRWILGHME